MIELKRDIKIDLIQGKYKCTSAYKMPDKPEEWLNCPNCNLKPLTWEFDNGRSTACGCGRNEYDHFSINAESIMSYGKRNNYNLSEYRSHDLKRNWNHWVETGEELEPREEMLELGRW